MRRFAVLYPDEKYGQTFMNLFWDEVISHPGASVVAAESYQADHTDFADAIQKLAGPHAKLVRNAGGTGRKVLAVDFEAIFIPDAPRRAGLVVPQLAYNDFPPIQLFGTNLWHSELLVTMARSYIQGAVMPEIFFAGSQDPRVKAFVDEFTRIYQRQPGFIEAALYDTAMLLFQSISGPEAGTRSAIRERLSGTSGFMGLTGETSFGETGNAQKSLYLLRIEGDDFVELPH
jgi:ABC-type branched-subunit amino acid transport system substrate-binding protein